MLLQICKYHPFTLLVGEVFKYRPLRKDFASEGVKLESTRGSLCTTLPHQSCWIITTGPLRTDRLQGGLSLNAFNRCTQTVIF